MQRVVPEALRRVRHVAGVRQVDIAERSGLSKAMVSAYEGGKALPSLPSLCAYLGAIGRDFRDLQDAVDLIDGPEVETIAELDQERAIGRAILGVFRALRVPVNKEFP